MASRRRGPLRSLVSRVTDHSRNGSVVKRVDRPHGDTPSEIEICSLDGVGPLVGQNEMSIRRSGGRVVTLLAALVDRISFEIENKKFHCRAEFANHGRFVQIVINITRFVQIVINITNDY